MRILLIPYRVMRRSWDDVSDAMTIMVLQAVAVFLTCVGLTDLAAKEMVIGYTLLGLGVLLALASTAMTVQDLLEERKPGTADDVEIPKKSRFRRLRSAGRHAKLAV